MAWYLSLFLFFPWVFANEDYFIYPPPMETNGEYSKNLVWKLGSSQRISWATPLKEYNMSIWQQDDDVLSAKPGPFVFVRTLEDEGGGDGGAIEWTVQTYFLNLEDSPVFFFWAGANRPEERRFVSHYFNISRDDVVSASPTQTSTVIQSSSSSTPEQTSTQTPTSNPSINSTEGSQPDTPTKAPNALPIGLGVGLGLAFLLVLTVLFFFFKKRIRGKGHPTPPPIDPTQEHTEWVEPKQAGEQRYPVQPVELHSSQPPAELQGSHPPNRIYAS